MLNHCLLSVDYPKQWENVLAYLPAMTELLQIRHLTLIYVVEIYRRPTVEDSEAAAAGRLEELSARLQERLGISVDYRVRTGLPASETLKAAAVLEADGIITLNRSHSVGQELFLGNTALNLARMTRIPLLILPFDGDVPALGAPVILAYDCSKAADEARRQFITLMEAGATGIAVSVNDPEYEPESDQPDISVDSITAPYDRAEARKLTGRPVAEILATAAAENSPLIIIGKRGTTPIKELPLGSTAQGVARRSRYPVLLVPGK